MEALVAAAEAARSPPLTAASAPASSSTHAAASTVPMALSFASPLPSIKAHQVQTLSDGKKKKKKHSKPHKHRHRSKEHRSGKDKQRVLVATPDVACKRRKRTEQGEEPDTGKATRRLEFVTPQKKTRAERDQEGMSTPPQQDDVQDSDEEDDKDNDAASVSSVSSASSDECEVEFDGITLGNLRVVREAVSLPPAATTLKATQDTTTSSPLRSVNGMEYRFAVSSTVSSIAIAPNGQFLVAGFSNGTIFLYPLTAAADRYRSGVLLDHISARGMYTQLMVRVAVPDDGKFIFAGVYRGSTEIRAFEVDSIVIPALEGASSGSVGAHALVRSHEDDDDEDDSLLVDPSVRASVHAITHMHSDPKLKGFSAVKSVTTRRHGKTRTEYQLLCGLGIKNIHLWRFAQDDKGTEWTWECIFDKQSNGISVELLCFHHNCENQIISKSEHQNIRVWQLEEEKSTRMLKKLAHDDIKQTVDTIAVYGNYAYGGREALALVDLESGVRLDLDLPLTNQEERDHVKRRSAAASRPRRGRRSGSDEALGSQRLMRTVSQVAGRDSAPFSVGMCTDGSVFVHYPEHETIGMATPLQYIDGYEHFFQDPSLHFQAQFSDLTRVNTNGMLAVLPLPASANEKWVIAAANSDHLFVRSLDAFLHREQAIESATAKSSSKKHLRKDKNKSGEKSVQDTKLLERKKRKSSITSSYDKTQADTLKDQVVSVRVKPSEVNVNVESERSQNDVTSTPKAKPRRREPAPSPVVSSPSSASSTANTPERVSKLSNEERRALMLQEIEWTPQATKEVPCPQRNTASTTSQPSDAKTSSKPRSKAAHALFTNTNDEDEKENLDPETKATQVVVTLPKKRAAAPETSRLRKKARRLPIPSKMNNAIADWDAPMPDGCQETNDEESITEVLTKPLASDGSLLLTASFFQYGDKHARDATTEDPVDISASPNNTTTPAEDALYAHFTQQILRAKMWLQQEQQRLEQSRTCDECKALVKPVKRSAPLHWRKQLTVTATKCDEIECQHQQHVAAKRRALQAAFQNKIADLQSLWQLEYSSLMGRQELDALLL